MENEYIIEEIWKLAVNKHWKPDKFLANSNPNSAEYECNFLSNMTYFEFGNHNFHFLCQFQPKLCIYLLNCNLLLYITCFEFGNEQFVISANSNPNHAIVCFNVICFQIWVAPSLAITMFKCWPMLIETLQLNVWMQLAFKSDWLWV